MCWVSMVMDYARQNVPLPTWTPDAFRDFKDVLRRLDELDKKLGQPDCHDPRKAEFMKQIEERLAKLEKVAADK